MHSISSQENEILIIGAGGAGLRAAIEAKALGKEVLVVGKRSKLDAHTVLAAGGINAAFGNLDVNDSWEQHFSDTYLEGYGLGNPDIIEMMVKEAPLRVEEIDRWGANFKKLRNNKLDQRFFGAHTYRRTCYSGDYTGKSILEALLKKAESMQIPILDTSYITELIINHRRCIGAISFDVKTGIQKIIISKAVIICTGGHTGIWKRNSSRKDENHGDGLALAINAGCELIDMEMVQFHPTGMVFPEEVSGTLVTEAVRGEGGRLFNNKGERFMQHYDRKRLELSTRDKVAIANYIEISEGRGTKNGAVYLDISHVGKEIILEKIPNIYKQFLDFQNLDISREPMEVAPTAHYSMGGIKVCADRHSTSIEGLFAAGEVTGGLHGANRLGGNSLAEILVFGKIAGQSASEYSSKNDYPKQISKVIVERLQKSFENISFKDIDNTGFYMENIKDIMWDYCGVIKNKKNLETGIDKLDEIEMKFNNSGKKKIRNDSTKLAELFNIKCSFLIAKLTMFSSLRRNESRGAHQRSDFKKINNFENYNLLCKFKNGQIYFEFLKTNFIKKNLLEIIKNDRRNENINIKLLE